MPGRPAQRRIPRRPATRGGDGEQGDHRDPRAGRPGRAPRAGRARQRGQPRCRELHDVHRVPGGGRAPRGLADPVERDERDHHPACADPGAGRDDLRPRHRRRTPRPGAAARPAPPVRRPRPPAPRRRALPRSRRPGGVLGSALDGQRGRPEAGALDGDRAGSGADVPHQRAGPRRELGQRDGAHLGLGDHARPVGERVVGQCPARGRRGGLAPGEPVANGLACGLAQRQHDRERMPGPADRVRGGQGGRAVPPGRRGLRRRRACAAIPRAKRRSRRDPRQGR